MNTEKKCTYCNQELDLKKHGLTKYCSVQCRNKDYYKKNKLRNDNFIENEQTNKSKEENEDKISAGQQSNKRSIGSISDEIISRNERGENGIAYSNPIQSSGRSDDLARYYDAKVEATRYELKCQFLENRIKDLEQEIMQLESELEECQSENQGNENNIIGGLVSSFKNDPLNTIEFGTAMIQKLFNKSDIKARPNQL